MKKASFIRRSQSQPSVLATSDIDDGPVLELLRSKKPERSCSMIKTEKHIVGMPSQWEERRFEYQRVTTVKCLCELSSRVWEIQLQDVGVSKIGRGTCFLGKFEVDNATVFGLFTANHVLGEKGILKCVGNKMRVSITSQEHQHAFSYDLNIADCPFCFTCPLLDVTFIEFNEEVYRDLSQYGFLRVLTQWKVPDNIGKKIHVLHYPVETPFDHAQYYSTGHLEQHQGLHVFHTASTNAGSSGAPIVIESCDVVAIHTARPGHPGHNYNVAVSAGSFFRAFVDTRSRKSRQRTHLPMITHHPAEPELKCLKDLIGLQLDMKLSDNDCLIPVYFSRYLRVSGVKAKVAIHFVLTSHGWYWSATAPDYRDEEPKWVPATSRRFDGESYYRGRAVLNDSESSGFSFEKLQSIRLNRDVIELLQLEIKQMTQYNKFQ